MTSPQTVLAWSLAHIPGRHKVSLLPRSRTELEEKLTTSLGYLAMGNLTVTIRRMGRDDLKISYTLKSKHCQMRENHPKKSEKVIIMR